MSRRRYPYKVSWDPNQGLDLRCLKALVKSPSHVWLFATPWTAACQAHLFSSISQSLLKFMSTESMILSNHLIFCHPLLRLLSIFPSNRVFLSELTLCTMWLKYWSFSFSINPSSENSGLIFFGIDHFDLLVVQSVPVAQPCPTLCKHMDYSTPDFSVYLQLLELTLTPIHLVGDVIQPTHPLSTPSPSAFNLSQHHGLF